jgi:plastocyanin
MKIRFAAALAAAGVLVVPVAAEAATKTVVMGPTPKVSKSLEKSIADLNNFYPGNISVRRGDKVSFVPFGLHNASFPKRGGKPTALLAPGAPVSGSADAAGAPFWFNGQPNFGFNPALLKMAFGKTVTYTGAKAVDSGLPLADKPKPFVVKFTKQGSFTYYCSVHPRMKGKVTVKGTRASVPSPKADAARGAKEMDKDAKAASKLLAVTPPANTMLLGNANSRGVETFGIFPGGLPGKLTVPTGTTVEFKMAPNSREAHTATFGPGNPDKDPNSYLGTIAKSFQEAPQFDARAVYPSEPPSGTPTVLTPALHGNGFWNSGILDSDKATPLPDSSKVTFGAPGSYTFYCMIHPFMTGTVTVT